jgi:hypothetical protein
MANGYIVYGDGSTANHGVPSSFNPSPPVDPIHYKNATRILSFSNPLNRPDIYAAVFSTGVSEPFLFNEDDIAGESAVADFQGFYPPSGGNLIYISFTTALFGDTIRIRTFDMDANGGLGAWQTVISAAGPIAQQSRHRLIHRANGDWVIVYDTFAAGQGNVFWSKWNGVSWSAAVKVSTVAMAATDSANIIDVALNETTGDIAIYWDLTKFSEGYNIHHKYLTVLSGVDVLGTNYNWQNNTERPGWESDGRPVYNSAQDQWEYPFITGPSDAPSTYRLLAIAESAPAGNPATTTIIPIVGGQDLDTVAFPRLSIDRTTSTLYFLWANNFQASFSQPPQMLFITRPLDGSTPFLVTQSTNQYGDLQWVPDGMVTADFDQSVQPGPTFSGVAYDASIDSLFPDPTVTQSVVDLNFFSVQNGQVRLVFNPLCDFQYYGETAPPVPPPAPIDVNVIFCGVVRFMILDTGGQAAAPAGGPGYGRGSLAGLAGLICGVLQPATRGARPSPERRVYVTSDVSKFDRPSFTRRPGGYGGRLLGAIASCVASFNRVCLGRLYPFVQPVARSTRQINGITTLYPHRGVSATPAASAWRILPLNTAWLKIAFVQPVARSTRQLKGLSISLTSSSPIGETTNYREIPGVVA